MKIVVVERLNSSNYAVDLVGVYSDIKLALLAVYKTVTRLMPVAPLDISYNVTTCAVDDDELKPSSEGWCERVHVYCTLRFNNPPVTGFKRELIVNYSPIYEDAVKSAFEPSGLFPVVLNQRTNWAKDEQSN